MESAFRGYDDATGAMLSGVFERAWEQVRLKSTIAADPSNAQAAREELLKRITEAHKNGEQNAEELELIAVRTFDRWAKPEEIRQTRK